MKSFFMVNIPDHTQAVEYPQTKF